MRNFLLATVSVLVLGAVAPAFAADNDFDDVIILSVAPRGADVKPVMGSLSVDPAKPAAAGDKQAALGREVAQQTAKTGDAGESTARQ